MNLQFFTKYMKIPRKRFWAVTLLTSGTIAWFYVIDAFLGDLPAQVAGSQIYLGLGIAAFFGSAALSAVIGSVISEKVSRRKFLWSWILLGILTTFSLLFFQGAIFIILSSVFLGLSLGLGFPSCMAIMAESTVVEERARVAGTLILQTFVLVFLAQFLIQVLKLGSIGVVLLCVGLRSISILALILDSSILGVSDRQKEKETSWVSILTNRQFVFYIVPFFLFNISAGLMQFVWAGIVNSPNYSGVFATAGSLRYVGAAIFGIISGVVADRIGRKLPIVIALVLLGIGFAFLGFAITPVSVFVYLMLSGVAWGILMVIYLAVPGDLAFFGSRERFYAVGWALPVFVYTILNSAPTLLGFSVTAGNIISPILSIIVFLSAVPVLYSTETLSDAKIRARKMQEYIKKVGKLVAESKKGK